MHKPSRLRVPLLKFYTFPLYPVLFSAYPVLALFAYNVNEVRVDVCVRPLLVSIGVTLLFWVILWVLYRDLNRSSFALTMFQLLFFSYGHIYLYINERYTVAYLSIWLPMVWLALVVLIFWFAGQRNIFFDKISTSLNLITLGLVALSGFLVLSWSVSGKEKSLGVENAPLQKLQISSGQYPPDIYYIILDSYARADLLQKAYGFDNSAFIRALEALGFYVADCSQTNYTRTELVLASTLNLEYLQNLGSEFDPESTRRRPLWNAIRYSTARFELQELGYRTVAFATGYPWSELDNADIYLTPMSVGSLPTDFEVLLLETTLARVLDDLGVVNLEWIAGERYRERTLLVFDSFENLAHMPGPKFVFIHLIPPHPPFIFGPDGEATNPAAFLNENNRYSSKLYAVGYQNQITFVNRQIESALMTLISESSIPPVIILQGDHGPWMQSGSHHFKILNAYYLPGQQDLLYPAISPVNTFRVIFNAYLNGHYHLLPDISYYSPVPKHFDFKEVSNTCIQD